MAEVEDQNQKWLIVHRASEATAKLTEQETYLERAKMNSYENCVNFFFNTR